MWQIAFLIIASDPLRFRPMMIAAILEKLSFAVPTTVLFMTGRSPSVVFGAAMFDLFLGVLFVLSLPAHRAGSRDTSRTRVLTGSSSIPLRRDQLL